MPRTIDIMRRYPFPRDMVWAALTESEPLAEWLMDNDFELEVGHRFRFTDRPQGGWRGFMECEVLAYEAPRELVLRWQGMPDHSVQRVTFTLEADGGGTTLSLAHEGFDGTMGRFDGFVLRQLLGRGWKRMFDKQLPAVLAFMRRSPGEPIPRGTGRTRR